MRGDSPPSLRRSVSLPWLVLYGLGTTVGAGIYVLLGVAAGRAGSFTPVSFMIAALLALPTALSFAELSARLPRAGGEAIYVQEALRLRWLSVAVGLGVVAAGVISAATVSAGFAGYLGAYVALPKAAVIGVLILLVGGVAAWGVRESVVVAGLMTLVELGGLALIVSAGWDHVSDLPRIRQELVPSDWPAWQAIGATAVLCFYAFLGFEDMVNVAEEVRDARRTLPTAILATLALVALAYGLVATVSVLAVPAAELAASDAPLALVYERCGGSPQLLGLIALIALPNGALVQIVKSSRVLYGLAREGSLPVALGDVHRWTRTPLKATLLVTLTTAALALLFPLAALAEATALITLTTFALANASLVALKLRNGSRMAIDERGQPPLSFPIAVPVCGCALSAGFVLSEFARLAS